MTQLWWQPPLNQESRESFSLPAEFSISCLTHLIPLHNLIPNWYNVLIKLLSLCENFFHDFISNKDDGKIEENERTFHCIVSRKKIHKKKPHIKQKLEKKQYSVKYTVLVEHKPNKTPWKLLFSFRFCYTPEIVNSERVALHFVFF